MQIFVDESGDFNISSGRLRFNAVAGLALPESPSSIMELVARQIVELEGRAPSTWRRNGELKGALIPTDELRRTLSPILDIQGPVFVVAAFIDQSYQETSQIDVFRKGRLAVLKREKQAETASERQHQLADEIRFVRDASSVVLMRSYVALPKVVVNAMVMMQPYYPPEFEPALERLEVIVDRDSFLNNRLTRHRVVKRRVFEELDMHSKRWGFKELRQWHDRGLQHPGERLAARRGSPGSWTIDVHYELNADAAGRPPVLLGDLVAAAVRRDLETASETTASSPIIFAERRVFPVLTGLGTLPDAEQKKALKALSPLCKAWGVRFFNEADVQ